MKVIIIVGPQAVGKMTVGLKLSELTGYGLFHNHHSIELSKEIYGDFSKDAKILSSNIRQTVFETTAKSGMKGFIFTFVWAFNYPEDHDYVKNIIDLYESHGSEVCIVELESPLETRVKRNKTPLRLEKKASKRDVAWSENELITSLDKYRLNSTPGEVTHQHYIKINNKDLEPEIVAKKIMDAFQIEPQ